MRYEEDKARDIMEDKGLWRTTKSYWKKNGVIPSKHFICPVEGVLKWDGKTIKDWMKDWDMTSKELAYELKVHEEVVRRWRRPNNEVPNLKQQLALLKIQEQKHNDTISGDSSGKGERK